MDYGSLSRKRKVPKDRRSASERNGLEGSAPSAYSAGSPYDTSPWVRAGPLGSRLFAGAARIAPDGKIEESAKMLGRKLPLGG